MIWTHTHEINWFCGEFLAYPQPSISTSFGPTRGYGNSFDLDTGDGWILDFQPLSRIEQDGKFHEQNYETSSRSAWDFYESLKMNGPFTRWVESWIASSQVLHDKRRTVPHPGLALGLASVPGGLRSMRMNEEPSIQDTVTGHGTMSHNAKPHIYECETRPNSNRQMQALFGRWSAGHLWIVAMMRPIYLWGASSVWKYLSNEPSFITWKFLMDLQLSAAKSGSPNKDKKCFVFMTSQPTLSHPFPQPDCLQTKRVYKGWYHSPPLSPVHPCPSITCYEALPGSAMTRWSFELDNPSPRYWEHLSPTPFPSSLLQKVSL